MARLVIKSAEFGNQVIELNLGVNRLGRNAKNDFPIVHPTVSARHCEIVLTDEAIMVRDCESANGTFLNGRRITEAKLSAGQTLQLGEVELVVETTDVTIAIPELVQRPAPPVVLSDGSLVCPRHPEERVTHQCTHCREVLCEACMHRLRRRGGKVMKLCPLCSHVCVSIAGEKRKKKSLFGIWRKTVRLPFLHDSTEL